MSYIIGTCGCVYAIEQAPHSTTWERLFGVSEWQSLPVLCCGYSSCSCKLYDMAEHFGEGFFHHPMMNHHWWCTLHNNRALKDVDVCKSTGIQAPLTHLSAIVCYNCSICFIGVHLGSLQVTCWLFLICVQVKKSHATVTESKQTFFGPKTCELRRLVGKG